MNITKKSILATACAACATTMIGLSALADGTGPTLPTASVRQLTAEELAEWNAENPYGIPAVDMSGPYDEHSVGKKMYVSAGYCKADVGFLFQANTDEKVHDFDNWWVDYVVYVDGKVAKNSMGLAGYYEQWGVSLGFFAPVEIPSAGENENAKIPLLNSVMKRNFWNYGQIRDQVKTFKCGVFNLAAENNNTKLTVELRIFHPDMKTEMITDPSTWITSGENVNTYVITTHTYKLVGKSTLPPGEGHGPLTCAGIAKGTKDAPASVPVGYFYLDSESGLFTKVEVADSYKVTQQVAYFTEGHTVAKIGNVAFATLADAIAAAADGDTIELTEANSETITATTAKLFTIDPKNYAFSKDNITVKPGCELVKIEETGVYAYRMQVTVKDVVTMNVVETKVDTEVDTAAVALTDENITKLFPVEGAKTLQIVASGVGTVSFDPQAVTKIGQNITNVITQAGGTELDATAKTTVTVAIADVTKENPTPGKPLVIIETNGTEQIEHEVVQAISVTAILQTIVTRGGSSTAVTNEEVFAATKAAGISTVTVPYSGITPQVWYIDTAVTPWTTNKMTTAYNAATKELSFEVAHFSEYVVTDAEVLAAVGVEKFATLAEAFAYVSTNEAANGATIRLTKDCEISATVTLAAGRIANLDLNGKKLSWADGATDKSKGLVANDGTLTILDSNPGGEMDAGADNVFTTCGSTTNTTTILNGKYTGTFPATSSTVTNAGPILVSGGAFYTSTAVPPAYWAVGYKANDATVQPYGMTDCEIYIRDISAAQRYPWNGYVDINFVVRWHRTEPARLFIFAYDANSNKLAMTQTTLIGPDGGTISGTCSGGYLIEALNPKNLHLMWNSTEDGAVPVGTVKKDVSFEFIAK